jgi:hypothetical protein
MGDQVSKSLTRLLNEEKDVFVLASAVKTVAKLNLDVETISKFLKHKDTRIRANTVRAIAITGREKIRILLEPMLKDKSYMVQNEALKALSSLIPEQELYKLIVKRLNSDNPKFRASTTYLLGELPLPQKTGLLCEKLNDDDNAVVICAARAIASLEDPIGIRSLLKLYFECENDDLISSLKNIISQTADAIMHLCSNLENPSQASVKKISRMVFIAEKTTDWEKFLPWVIACLQKCRHPDRLAALKIIYANLDFFHSNIENLLQLYETTPEENAFIHLIKWKSGSTSDLKELEKMLYSNKPPQIKAAVKILRFDNSIFARNCLKQAANAGIILALEPDKIAKNLVDKPIKLPVN